MFRRSCRFAIRSVHRSRRTYASLASNPVRQTITRALTAQDPYGRIRFLVGPSAPSWERYLWWKYPGAISIEAYALPFWTLLYFWSIGTGPTGAQIDKVDQVATCGLTLSAVETDHWASGMVLRDDPEFILRSGGSMEFDASRWTQEGSTFLSEHWNPSIAPLFGHGYAKELPGTFVLSVQKHARGVWTPQSKELIPVRQTSSPYAFPHYRIIYKIDMPDGSTKVGDGSKDIRTKDVGDLNIFDLPAKHPKCAQALLGDKNPRKAASNAGDRKLSWQHWRAAPIRSSDLDPAIIARYSQKGQELADTTNMIGPGTVGHRNSIRQSLTGLAVASMGSRLSWKDPYIMPPDLFTGNTLAGAWDYALKRMSHVRRDAPLYPGLSPSKPTRPLSPVSLRPPPLTTSSRQSPATQPREKTGRSNPKPTYVTATPEPAPRLSSPKLKHEAPRAQPMPLPNPPSTAARPPPKLSPALERIPDPLGWYRELGIAPTTIFLDRSRQVSAADIIAAARRSLSLKHHPDRNGGDGAKLAHINYVCDHLRNCT